jgi:DNA repair exonuclease SbcCD ATPase subunit
MELSCKVQSKGVRKMPSFKEYQMMFQLNATTSGQFQAAFSGAQNQIAQLQGKIDALNRQQGDITAYTKQQAAVEKTRAKLETLRQQYDNLKAAQDKAAKEARNQAKMDAAASIITDVLTFCATYYPSFGLTLDDNVSDEEIETLVTLIITLLDVEAMRPEKKSILGAKLPVDIKLKSEPKKTMTTDEVFAEAFKMLGL